MWPAVALWTSARVRKPVVCVWLSWRGSTRDWVFSNVQTSKILISYGTGINVVFDERRGDRLRRYQLLSRCVVRGTDVAGFGKRGSFGSDVEEVANRRTCRKICFLKTRWRVPGENSRGSLWEPAFVSLAPALVLGRGSFNVRRRL